MSTELPQDFLNQIKIQLKEEYSQFVEALEAPSPVSIRHNPSKSLVKEVLCYKPIPWAVDGCYLKERISFTADPLFHAGAYYVQEASSMLLEKAFNTAFPTEKPELVLDLCAAPGGKSTHLLSLMEEQGVLISNEIHPTRNSILRQNLARWGYASSLVTQLPPSSFRELTGMFDMVVVDAPCSGEGMFRKDPSSIQEWSTENVENCAERQEDILNIISDTIRQYGYLIYSTCTYNTIENDEQVGKLIDSKNFEVVELDLAFSGAVKTKFGWQCYPHKVQGEGFFISLLRKIKFESKSGYRKIKDKAPLLKANLPFSIPENLSLIKIGNIWHAYPTLHEYIVTNLSNMLPVKSSGIPFGEEKGKDFIPAPEFAYYTRLPDDVSKLEVTLEEALKFLRCETFLVDLEKGWYCVTYKGLGLGWIKALQGRMNNYFPKNWRILKDIDKLQ